MSQPKSELDRIEEEFRSYIHTEVYMAIAAKQDKHLSFSGIKHHFEYVTRQEFLPTNKGNSVLAPSWSLLKDVKLGKTNWEEYCVRYIKEITENPAAQKRIQELREITKVKPVYVICVEKNAGQCHRSLLANLIIPNSWVPDPPPLETKPKGLDVFFG